MSWLRNFQFNYFFSVWTDLASTHCSGYIHISIKKIKSQLASLSAASYFTWVSSGESFSPRVCSTCWRSENKGTKVDFLHHFYFSTLTWNWNEAMTIFVKNSERLADFFLNITVMYLPDLDSCISLMLIYTQAWNHVFPWIKSYAHNTIQNTRWL